MDSSGSRWGPVAGFCEHGNELSVSKKKKAGNFLSLLRMTLLHGDKKKA
jgi:hypothetical protein